MAKKKRKKRRPRPPAPKRDLEGEFLAMVKGLRARLEEGMVREHVFHPTRKWRFDFAWPAIMLAVEIEGGHFSGGRHLRGTGFLKDCEKYNAAALAGWRVLRFTSSHIDAPGEMLRVFIAARRRIGGGLQHKAESRETIK